jgi:uncharacterized Rmd1/YagE family protein
MKNRFAGLKTAKTLQNSADVIKPETTVKPSQRGVNKQETSIQSNTTNSLEARRRGRPNGKRSNENFRQVTAYVGKETYKQTKMKLLAADNQQEFSELIDDLLVRWLQEK